MIIYRKKHRLLNMICGLNMTSPHPSKITKWPHIIIIPLVGPPEPRTKSKNSPTHPETEKSGAKVMILGDLIARFRVLIRRCQTWACGYEEIWPWRKNIKKSESVPPPFWLYPKSPKSTKMSLKGTNWFWFWTYIKQSICLVRTLIHYGK